MWCGLCGFLIIKLQIALLHAVWCDVVHCYLRYNVVMPFCRQFWCDLCGLCGLVNTPTLAYPTVDMMSLCLMLFWRSNTIILLIWTHNIHVPRTVIMLKVPLWPIHCLWSRSTCCWVWHPFCPRIGALTGNHRVGCLVSGEEYNW